MKTLAPLTLAVLTACAAPTAPPNPNSVPNVLLNITQARQSGTHIFLNGGIYDGAATGQTANFVVLPTDQIICTFQNDPVFPADRPTSTVTAHRLTVPGIYAQFAAIFVPNVIPPESELTTNFTVQTGSAGDVITTATGFGDPRFDRLMTLFQTNPTPCWAFG
jgi:hypothetical protein